MEDQKTKTWKDKKKAMKGLHKANGTEAGDWVLTFRLKHFALFVANPQ